LIEYRKVERVRNTVFTIERLIIHPFEACELSVEDKNSLLKTLQNDESYIFP